MTARWAAVVVNHEAGALLADAVSSVLADDTAGCPELVVVDNDSRDDSIELLRAAVPGVRVIDAPGNVGYARAANLGIAAVRASVVAVLNPDLRVERGTAAAVLARIGADTAVGACGPRIKNTDGSDYPSARSVPPRTVAVMHAVLGPWWPTNPYTRRYRQLDADPERPRLVDWVSGAAVWLRRRALDEVGGWDERYFMYMEDVDLCWRLRRAGWHVAYEPGGTVWHVQGASTARRPYRMIVEHHRSVWRFSVRRDTGWRRLALPGLALLLTVRAAVALAARSLARVRGARPPG